MAGGLLQLVAYGAQDVYLTGNPQITFFKVVYRRHTNFAIESIEQTFNGTSNIGSRVSVLVTRNGDLINRIYFKGKITNKPGSGSSSCALVPYFGLRLFPVWHIGTDYLHEIGKSWYDYFLSGVNFLPAIAIAFPFLVLALHLVL